MKPRTRTVAGRRKPRGPKAPGTHAGLPGTFREHSFPVPMRIHSMARVDQFGCATFCARSQGARPLRIVGFVCPDAEAAGARVRTFYVGVESALAGAGSIPLSCLPRFGGDVTRGALATPIAGPGVEIVLVLEGLEQWGPRFHSLDQEREPGRVLSAVFDVVDVETIGRLVRS